VEYNKNISDEIKLICINNTGCESYLTLNKSYVGIIDKGIKTGNEITFICDDGCVGSIPIENIKNRFIIQAELREQQIKSVLDD
jgi:hypothetical protein